MDTRRIGSLDVSIVGLGCNNFGQRIDGRATQAVVHAALDAGITFFDTADIYGHTQSEEFLGRALGAKRGDVIVATKFGMAVDEDRKGAHPDYVRQACEDSLRRLGTDYIDLYQLHEPDPTVPIADTLGAMNELVREGKVREIGCSNFDSRQLREANAISHERKEARFVSVQNEYSLMHRDPERDVLATCEELDLAFIPFFPLYSGLLTGKYHRGEPAPPGTRLAAGHHAKRLTDANLATVEQLRDFAEAHGHSLLELAFAYLLAHRPVASVIAGATKPEQVASNVKAATAWRMTNEELTEVPR